MASIHEAYGSRSRSGNTTTYRYVVTGTDDLDEALNLLATTAPESLADGAARGDPSLTPNGAGADGTWWDCDVPYTTNGKEISNDIGADPGSPPPPTGYTGDEISRGAVAGGANGSDQLKELFGTSFNFSTGGGTMMLYKSLGTTNFAPTGKVAPDHKGSINVQPDKTVEGVEILAPKGSFSTSRKVPNLTVGYFKAAISKTATTNAKAWKGFGRCEVLFEGIEGSYRGGIDVVGAWELTWHFGFSPTDFIKVPAGWDPIAKRGWEYLWWEFEPVDDTVADPKKPSKRPFAGHIEIVYEETDFDEFRL